MNGLCLYVGLFIFLFTLSQWCFAEPFPIDLPSKEVEKLKIYAKNMKGEQSEILLRSLMENQIESPVTAYLIARFLAKNNAFSAARRFYEYGRDLNHYASAVEYYNYLAFGKGGEQDILESLRYFTDLQDRPFYDAVLQFYFLHFDIEKHWPLGIRQNYVYWLEYGADNIHSRDEDEQWGKANLYKIIANDYAYSANYFASKKQYDRQINDLKIARSYYKKGNLRTKLIELNAKMDEAIRKETETIAEADNRLLEGTCKRIFSSEVDRLKEFKFTQSDIVRHPSKSAELANDYRESVLSIPAGLKPDTDVTLYFGAIKLPDLFRLYLSVDPAFASFDEIVVEAANNINTLNVAIYAENALMRDLIVRLLAELNIHVECASEKLVLVTENGGLPRSHYFNAHFVVEWNGDVRYLNDSFEGKGNIAYENGERHFGNFKNSKLYGAGRLERNSGGEVIQNERFDNGTLQGVGKVLHDGEAMYIGDYIDTGFAGTGAFAKYEYRYTGEHESLTPHGKGRIEYLKRNLPEDHTIKFWYPIAAPADVAAWFDGAFEHGKRHGLGVCGIISPSGKEQELSCEYYEDHLIKLDDLRLLPEKASYQTHFRWQK